MWRAIPVAPVIHMIMPAPNRADRHNDILSHAQLQGEHHTSGATMPATQHASGSDSHGGIRLWRTKGLRQNFKWPLRFRLQICCFWRRPASHYYPHWRKATSMWRLWPRYVGAADCLFLGCKKKLWVCHIHPHCVVITVECGTHTPPQPTPQSRQTPVVPSLWGRAESSYHATFGNIDMTGRSSYISI